MDITGDGAMEFFSNRVKVTSKWPIVKASLSRKRKTIGDDETKPNGHHSSTAPVEPNDAANFAGQM